LKWATATARLDQRNTHTHTHTTASPNVTGVLEVCWSQSHLCAYILPDVIPVIKARTGLSPVQPRANLSFTEALPEYLRHFPTLCRPLEERFGSANIFSSKESWKTYGKTAFIM